jgi:hypothetical protein
MSKYDVKTEIKQKQRYVSDLIRFIKTRNDKNPNYSLLLGSGCSVTSGIKSGGELIKEWRKEIFFELIKYDKEYSQAFDNNNETLLRELSIKYLTEKHGSWYNTSNEYSSLFEKKYDLPSQRRMFVEEEVREKIPSIGYSYLVNLIKDFYINTIFTTNFDDLLNEAFYQYSEIRPIICAHDSSINSITVTSKRPKVIKLHGDYLFDDIKSTLKETETLENNIKNKFIEFGKDFGLIVVGYGGHDSSVMDVINYLLKHEDYYKNGIYWCIRKGDLISEDLKKLLWKDRVYFVEIDGFDELFAEIHHNIYEGKLPIDTKFVANKSQDIIKNFINNEHLSTSNSQIIQNDLEKLKKQGEQNSLFETLKNMNEEKGVSPDKLKDNEVTRLLELNNLFSQGRYSDIIQDIKEDINNIESKYFKIELLKKQFSAYIKSNLYEDAHLIIDKLIELDEKNPIHYIKKSNIENNYKNKLFNIEKAIELDEYSDELLNKKINLFIDKYDANLKNEVNKDEILKLLGKSLEINPSINNDAWEMKFDFLLEENKNNLELKELIEKLERQKPYSLTVLRMKYNLIDNDSDRLSFIQLLTKSKNQYLGDNKLDYELYHLNILVKTNNKELIKDKIYELDNSEYKDNYRYLHLKAVSIFKKFGTLSESISILKKLLENEKKYSIVNTLVEYLLYDGKIEEAKKTFEDYKYLYSRKNIMNYNIKIFEYESNYSNAYNEVKKLQELEIFNKGKYIEELSYYLIKDDKFQEAKNILFDYLNSYNFSKKLVVEIINYEFASKTINKTYNVNKSRLEPIKNSTSTDSMVKAVISVLEDKINDAYKYIKEAIEKDYSVIYNTKNWPIFNSIRSEKKFIELYTIPDKDEKSTNI